MSVAIPVLRWHSRCCCCCGGVSVGALAAFLGAAGEGELAPVPGESTAVAGAAPAGFLGWRSNPRAGETYRVPIALYERLKRAAEEPVFVLSKCGRDRDCTPDGRLQPSYRAATINARAWVARGNGRSVEIFSEPGRVLISRIQGSEADYAQFTATAGDEAEMQAIQRSPNATRYGFGR